MTNIIVIGDIIRSDNGLDYVVIGFTHDNKVILDHGGISDQEYFNVIGHYDAASDNIVFFD